MEIELAPDPGSDDPAARAALTALAGEAAGRGDDHGGWGLVAHSTAWWRAAVGEAVGRSDGLAARTSTAHGAPTPAARSSASQV